MKKGVVLSAVILIVSLLLTACSANQPIAQNAVAVYIFMAENDEYYGSEKARSAYEGLQRAWRELEVQQFRKRGYKHEKENGNDGMQYG